MKNPKKITLYISNADAEIKCNQHALGCFAEFTRGDELDKAIEDIKKSLYAYKVAQFNYKRIAEQKPKFSTEPKTNIKQNEN